MSSDRPRSYEPALDDRRRRWTYPPEFLSSLADFGLAPHASTHPAFVRDALNELYRYELRRQRLRLLAGDVEKTAYHDTVVQLRKRYWLLTLPPPVWERICARDADAARA